MEFTFQTNMHIRYLESTKDISGLIQKTHEALTRLGYKKDEAEFIIGEKPPILQEHIYTHNKDLIIARYSFGPNLAMTDSKNKTRSHCSGILALINQSEKEVDRIDKEVEATALEYLDKF